MKLVIDYTPAVRQTAGIGRIIRGQISELVQKNLGYDIRLFVAGKVSPEQRAAAPLPLHTFPRFSERNLTRIWHRLNIPAPRLEWLTGGDVDLFHATDFVMAPVSANRKLLTVHDLAFMRYPQAAMPSLHHYLNVVVPRSISRADHLIADSQNTALDLESTWPQLEGRISVVQGAVDLCAFHRVSGEEALDAVRQKYAIGDRPYIFALSTLEPRKNYPRLIRAYHAARRDSDLPHRLVIGGKKGWLFDEIFATVRELGIEEDVHFPGFVDDADLPALYSGAEFFAYPSLYEGFGLPIIEALACGTPVLTSDNSCLPEAGGEGAIYVDAESVESIAEGIVRLATQPELRAGLAAAGEVHARSFTWSRSLDQLLEAYERALA
ncbi:MAG: glycosyltransferase family 1 protein [Caldilineaceae bacterium]|nr:glycosyltransferase family 1 protein [Caldilineaceae bacterium]